MTEQKNIVDQFFKAKVELLDHVGHTPDWVEFPIDDCRGMYWKIDGNHVGYSEDKQMVINQFEEYYEDELCTKEYFQFWTKYWKDAQKEPNSYWKDEIYTQRFYSKWVYRGEKFTLIFCDPHVDGCKWSRIFANDKEL